jgi:hypothetical protein
LDLADDLLGLASVISEGRGVQLDHPEVLIENDESIAEDLEDRLRSLVAGAEFLLSSNVPGHIAAMDGYSEKRRVPSPDGLEREFDESLLACVIGAGVS